MRQVDFPQIFRIRQRLVSRRIADLEAAVRRALDGIRVRERVRPGQTAAVTAGSGIANYARILRTVVQYLRESGVEPFIVPAMGSHGGGTAEGQREVLARYGITAETMGCPIRASMETVVVGRAAEGFDVHFDRFAFQADHVLVVNRVKPHTQFTGPIESGLMKMLLIGLGKHRGAATYHRAVEDFGFDRIVRSVGRLVLERCRIPFGVGQGLDAAAALRRCPCASHRPPGQGRERSGDRHERDRSQIPLSPRRGRGAAPHSLHLRPRFDGGHPRQRDRHRFRRVLPQRGDSRHGCGGHADQRPHGGARGRGV